MGWDNFPLVDIGFLASCTCCCHCLYIHIYDCVVVQCSRSLKGQGRRGHSPPLKTYSPPWNISMRTKSPNQSIAPPNFAIIAPSQEVNSCSVHVYINLTFFHSELAHTSPLSFIFENTAYHGMEGLLKKVVPQDGEEMLNTLPWSCQSISPDNCCKGSLVLCE